MLLRYRPMPNIQCAYFSSSTRLIISRLKYADVYRFHSPHCCKSNALIKWHLGSNYMYRIAGLHEVYNIFVVIPNANKWYAEQTITTSQFSRNWGLTWMRCIHKSGYMTISWRAPVCYSILVCSIALPSHCNFMQIRRGEIRITIALIKQVSNR